MRFAAPRFPAAPRPRVSAVSSLALTLVASAASLALAVAMLACAGSLARADSSAAARPARPIGERVIPQQEIAGRLAQRGYVVNEPVVRRGTAYLTHGRDKWGQRLRLVMDARNGEIIGLRVLGEGQAPRRDPPASETVPSRP
jgi:hypothetical protein